MPVSPDRSDQRVAELSAALRGAGFRLTHQRLEVVREIAASETHPDADEVFRAVRTRIPTISLDTVYRTLGTLADLGLVARVPGVAGAVRYDANTGHHHHFACTRCGLIRDIDSPELDRIAVPDSVNGVGEVADVEVRMTGLCRACATT